MSETFKSCTFGLWVVCFFVSYPIVHQPAVLGSHCLCGHRCTAGNDWPFVVLLRDSSPFIPVKNDYI